MQYQYFIASRWRNKDSVLELTNKIREKGKSVYCFFEEKEKFHFADDPERAMRELEATSDWRNDEKLKEIFAIDMDALKNSESIILLLPAGKSAHLEAGVAYGLGKRCVLVGEQKEAESLYLMFDEFYQNINDFINSI